MFEDASLRHLPAIQSDHCPIFIFPNGFLPLQTIHRPFKFQVVWLTHENFRAFVEERWCSNSDLIPALASLANDLQSWNKDVFGNIFIQKRALLGSIAGI